MAVVIAGAFSATTVNAFSTKDYVGQIGTREEVRSGKYLVVGAFGKYTYVASNDSDHKGSLKSAKCTSYKYEKPGDKYVTYSKKSKTKAAKNVMTDNVTFDDSVAKIEYYGAVYRTSCSNSGILESGKIRIYRSGCPIK